ncbi:MAG: hypothetical protein H7X97_00520 [Opitutaceae bacterium]|nr:hypothetical protein [Verrucomicrobiales bacterium]
MSTTAVNLSTLSSNYSSAQERIPTQVLGQDDFLKLLVAQMTSQDPLSPQKDTEFISQMASFTSLEQTKTMQKDMAQMRGDQQVLQANSLLGRTVIVQADKETKVAGQVSAVEIEAGKPMVVVNGQSYDLSQVVTITPTVNSN